LLERSDGEGEYFARRTQGPNGCAAYQ
jgi:hypothetical protein